MLVSNAKPWKCKHRPLDGEVAKYTGYNLLDHTQLYTGITVTNLELIHAMNAAVIWVTVSILELIHAINAPTSPPSKEEQVY